MLPLVHVPDRASEIEIMGATQMVASDKGVRNKSVSAENARFHFFFLSSLELECCILSLAGHFLSELLSTLKILSFNEIDFFFSFRANSQFSFIQSENL